MLVEEPEQGDSSTANNEEEEFDVPVLIIGELVNKDLRACDVDKRAASETKHNRGDYAWCVLDPDTNADPG